MFAFALSRHRDACRHWDEHQRASDRELKNIWGHPLQRLNHERMLLGTVDFSFRGVSPGRSRPGREAVTWAAAREARTSRARSAARASRAALAWPTLSEE